jgi:MFS family permease
LVQCGTITGIVVASAVNVGTNHLVWGWRLSLAIAAIPGTILLLGRLKILLVTEHLHFLLTMKPLDELSNKAEGSVQVKFLPLGQLAFNEHNMSLPWAGNFGSVQDALTTHLLRRSL